jgi:hypothetical protein
MFELAARWILGTRPRMTAVGISMLEYGGYNRYPVTTYF